jgi:uncharacterized protein (TIGR02147 family)
METTDYRTLLKEVFAERRLLESKYSLRAFARDLDIEPAQLSRVLKGTHNISLQAAQKIAPRIFKQKRRQNFFLDLVSVSLAKRPQDAAAALARIERSQSLPSTLELSWIEVLSDWYNLALIDLISLPNAPADSHGLAKYLGISLAEVTASLERMQSLKLIEKKEDRWQKVSAELATPHGIPSTAIRRFHKQMIQKAIDSVDSQPVDERFLFGRTMTLKKSNLPKLEALTQEYLEQLRELSEDAEGGDSLYQVNVQAFNLKDEKGARP